MCNKHKLCVGARIDVKSSIMILCNCSGIQVPTIEEFLIQSLAAGDVVSSDAKLMGYGEWTSLQTQLSGNFRARLWA